MSEIIEDGMVVGPERGARIRKRWNPKEWRPEYEAIVALSCTGTSHKLLAERYGYTPVHISNIVNSDVGKELSNIILQNLRKISTESLPEKIGGMQAAAVKRMQEYLENDQIAAVDPQRMFDRALRFASEFGLPGIQMQKSGVNININKTNNTQVNILDNESQAALMDEIKRAALVMKQHVALPRNVEPEELPEIKTNLSLMKKIG